MPSMVRTPAWQALRLHARRLRRQSMRRLFDADPDRFRRYSREAAGIFLDWSKNQVDDLVMQQLIALAQQREVPERIKAMFAGEHINFTEGRAALHVALRAPASMPMQVDGRNVTADVQAVLARIERFVGRLHRGEWTGRTGRRMTDVVNIGIGGSDLGPVMAVEALRPYARPDLRVHFVSNIDGAHLADTLAGLDPDTTLFIVVSKTFTTLETLTNADSARRWFYAAGGTPAEVARHFVAVSSNAAAVRAFGIDPDNMFEFWDWVGGRYSMWSAVGLAIAVAVGMPHFRELLAGAHAMDRHFRTAPLADNLPVLLALIGIWNHNVMGHATHAVLPYDQHLHRLPAYLQQLDMESNGKSVDATGRRVRHATGPVLWGEPGTNGQHAFYQLIHQGSQVVPADFIAAVEPTRPLGRHHAMLLANFLAQPEALMRGKTLAEARRELKAQGWTPARIAAVAPHRVFTGNRPSNSLLVQRMTPAALGALIALYEHKVFVQGTIWDINSFDQWGVELGKQLAGHLLNELEGSSEGVHDASTRGLLQHIRARQQR